MIQIAGSTSRLLELLIILQKVWSSFGSLVRLLAAHLILDQRSSLSTYRTLVYKIGMPCRRSMLGGGF
jgi:hypothetical protein